MSEIHISRQPIYGRELDVQAYELLYRSVDIAETTDLGNDDATSQELINAIIEIDLDELVGNHPAIIHCSKEFLLRGLPAPTAGNKLVLKVLEDSISSDIMLRVLGQLKNTGYPIVLDQFIYDESKRPLVELADIIRLDVLQLATVDELEKQVTLLKEFDVQLLADKVETHEDFDRCKMLGFELFQGNFLTKPRIVTGQRTPANKTTIIQLLAELQDPAVDFQKLEELIKNDVSLSHRILRYTSSALFSMRKPVDSIHKAITRIGLNPIKSWVSIIAMSKIDDKPQELMIQTMVRAKMCELLASEASLAPDVAFTIGLFSNLDVLMDQQLRDILVALPLSTDTYAAILHYEGDLGELLALVLDYESGDWDSVENAAHAPANLQQTYLDAVHWATETRRQLLTD